MGFLAGALDELGIGPTEGKEYGKVIAKVFSCHALRLVGACGSLHKTT